MFKKAYLFLFALTAVLSFTTVGCKSSGGSDAAASAAVADDTTDDSGSSSSSGAGDDSGSSSSSSSSSGGSSSSSSSSSGAGALLFSEEFTTVGSIAGVNWSACTVPGLGNLPIINGDGTKGVPSNGAMPNCAAWANPDVDDITESYQEVNIVSNATIGTGVIGFLGVRIDPSSYTGYSCQVKVNNITDKYAVSIVRVDPGPDTNIITNGGEYFDSTIDVSDQAEVPFKFGCETVVVNSDTHIRIYIGSDVNADPTLVYDYVLGTDEDGDAGNFYDQTPYTATGTTGALGFHTGADSAASNHFYEKYSIFSGLPF